MYLFVYDSYYLLTYPQLDYDEALFLNINIASQAANNESSKIIDNLLPVTT